MTAICHLPTAISKLANQQILKFSFNRVFSEKHPLIDYLSISKRIIMGGLSILNCPSNLGLKQPFPGHEPGVRKLPGWFRQHGLHERLQPVADRTVEAPAYEGRKHPVSAVLNGDQLVQYTRQVADAAASFVSARQPLLMVGGDCSIMLGAALALRRLGRYGLFYLDGHTDFMDISLSQTGGAGGMAASMAAGRAHPMFADIDGLSPYMEEAHIWCVGNREYDDAYEDEVRNSDAVYYPLHALRKKGMEAVAGGFLAAIESHKLDGFWVHFDVDVLDDAIMPCVDSRTPDGLSYEELRMLLTPLLQSSSLAGISVTILDPELDPESRYTPAFVDCLAGLLISRSFGENV